MSDLTEQQASLENINTEVLSEVSISTCIRSGNVKSFVIEGSQTTVLETDQSYTLFTLPEGFYPTTSYVKRVIYKAVGTSCCFAMLQIQENGDVILWPVNVAENGYKLRISETFI